MRSTPDNDRPDTDRRKGSRRRSQGEGAQQAGMPPMPPGTGSNTNSSEVVSLHGERRTQDRRASGASSGMRMKAAKSNQTPQAIAQSMIDALTDILRYEQKRPTSKAS